MSMPPYYASPEQIMKDRADYARRNIARGRPVAVLSHDGGIVCVAVNPQRSLHKISEIYDRIAFAAVGKYNEFENLRVAGVRYADLRGYSYDRSDVTARGLANAYAQTLGSVFTNEPKPMEVEIAVAEVGIDQDHDLIFRLTYDGSVSDEGPFVAMGGQAEAITTGLTAGWRPGMTLSEALRLAVSLLAKDPAGGADRTMNAGQLEVAILDRQRPRRAFRRLGGSLLERLLSAEDPVEDAPHTDEPGPGLHDTLTDAPADATQAGAPKEHDAPGKDKGPGKAKDKGTDKDKAPDPDPDGPNTTPSASD